MPKLLPIKTILLDRDGTIIYDRHYLSQPDGVCLLPHAGEALARAVREGRHLFAVTNQSGIGRGYFSQNDFFACQTRLGELLAEYGVALTGSRFCPHAPDETCTCRKPAAGMWHSLKEAYNLHAAQSIMVGDKLDDIAFGHNARLAASVLVLTGKGQDAALRLGFTEDRINEVINASEHTQNPAYIEQAEIEMTAQGVEQHRLPHCIARDLNAVMDWLTQHEIKDTPHV